MGEGGSSLVLAPAFIMPWPHTSGSKELRSMVHIRRSGGCSSNWIILEGEVHGKEVG